ncbi:PAS domain S-box protein [Haladaptatus sp. NG-WS-4]
MTDSGRPVEFPDGDDFAESVTDEGSFFHHLVYDATDVVVTTDSDGTIVFANAAVESLFGYAPNELIGERPAVLVPERFRNGQRDGFFGSITETPREGRPETVEMVGVDRDGNEIPLSVMFHEHTYDGHQLSTAIVRDVSDQKRTERQLREERELVQQVFETSPIALAVHSADGEVLRANDRALDMLGLEDVEEFSPVDERDDLKVYGADGEPLSPEEYAKSQVIRTKKPVYNFEIAIERPSIGRRWFSVNGVPLLNDDGDLERVVLAAEDITDLKRNQRELERRRRALETELEEIFDRVTDAFLAVDENGGFTYVNSHAERVFGTNNESLIGENMWETFPEMESFREQYETALESQEPVFFETFSEALSTWFDVRVYPSETGLSMYFRDVTERKERERELEQAKTMIETVEDGVYVLDETYQLVAVNDALVSMTGYSRDALLDSPASLLTDEETVKTGKKLQEEIRSGARDVATIETEFRRADGQEFPVEIRFSPLYIDDEFRGTVGVVRDTSERRAREAELREQNERLDTFAGALAHELRNPLSIAQGYLALAWEDRDERAYEEVKTALDRMENMIDSLLIISRGGGSVDTTEPIDLHETAETAWQTVATAAATLVVDRSQQIYVDPDHLRLLFENLFRNAVEHGGEGVTVRVGVIDDGFYVEDDGPGISAETRQHVFEPGYSTSSVGMGVGLTLIRQLSKAYGWEYAITEGRDGGARFEFTDVG